MNNVVKIWGLVLLGAVVFSSAFADDVPAGSYTQSCNSVSWDGSTLKAQCKVFGGNWFVGPVYVPTEIIHSNFNALNNNVGNSEGNMVANGVTPGGTWNNSCTASVYDVASNSLGAWCSDGHGKESGFSTSIVAAPSGSQFFNNHGNLVIANVTPAGSWSESCSGSTYNVMTHSLSAQCSDGHGSYYATSITDAPNMNQAWDAHGNLTATNVTPQGSWAGSCMASTYNAATQTLTAYCFTPGNNSTKYSSIQASPSDSVFNSNGVLIK